MKYNKIQNIQIYKQQTQYNSILKIQHIQKQKQHNKKKKTNII